MVTRKLSKASVLVTALALASCSGFEGSTDPEGDSSVEQVEGALSSSSEAAPSTLPASGTGTGAAPRQRLGAKQQAHQNFLARRGVAALTSLETLQQYATKCEDATGIRIPPFSCENGYEVPQGTVILSLTPLPRNTASFALPMLAAAIAPFGVGLALAIGSLAYAASAVAGWLALRETPDEIARIRQLAHADASEADEHRDSRPAPV